MRVAFSTFSPALPAVSLPSLRSLLVKLGAAIALLTLALGLWLAVPEGKSWLAAKLPSLPRAYHQAMQLRQEGDLLAALAKLEAAVAQAPASVPVLYELGRAEFQLSRVEDAIAHYRAALAQDPDHAPSAYELGSILVTLGNLEEGIGLLKHSAAILPVPLTYYDLGIALGRSGDKLGEIAQLNQAIALKPDYADAYLNLGITYARLGQLDAAKNNLQQARQLYQAEIEKLEHAHLGRNSLDAQIIDQMMAALDSDCGTQCWYR